MKNLAKQMFVSLITGLCFVVSIFVTWEVLDSINGHSASELEYIQLPQGLEIVDHNLKPETQRFTIEGHVKNNSVYSWEFVRVEAKIFAGAALMNKCDDRVSNVSINELRKFAVECYKVSGMNLPDNVTYEIYIQTAARLPGR